MFVDIYITQNADWRLLSNLVTQMLQESGIVDKSQAAPTDADAS